MSPVNIRLPFEAYRRGRRLGGGSYGTVYAWGPWVVKLGEVGKWEAAHLREAYARLPEMFPEFLHFRQTRDGFFGALFMSKIPGRPLSRTPAGKRRKALEKQARELLRSEGITHYDLHANNIMRMRNRLYVIDTDSLNFGPKLAKRTVK